MSIFTKFFFRRNHDDALVVQTVYVNSLTACNLGKQINIYINNKYIKRYIIIIYRYVIYTRLCYILYIYNFNIYKKQTLVV